MRSRIERFHSGAANLLKISSSQFLALLRPLSCRLSGILFIISVDDNHVFERFPISKEKHRIMFFISPHVHLVFYSPQTQKQLLWLEKLLGRIKEIDIAFNT